jgi:hypothetical protein
MQIIKVLKVNGYAYLEHFENEALYANYDGTHHWNFTEELGEFIVWSKTEKINMTKILKKYCNVEVQRENSEDRNMIKLHLTKFKSTKDLSFSRKLRGYLDFANNIRSIEIRC